VVRLPRVRAIACMQTAAWGVGYFRRAEQGRGHFFSGRPCLWGGALSGGQY